MSTALKLDQVTIVRSGSTIIRDLSLEATAGEITVLLGANGAGKTTLLEGISGVIDVASGQIKLNGTEMRTLKREKRAKLGLAHVEQGRTVFAGLTTEQNLLAAAPSDRLARAYEMFPSLERRRLTGADQLSGGEQQMLVLARAFLTEPKVVLLDEISLGLAPTIVMSLLPVVRDLADSGVGVVLVEQFADLALSIGDRAYVLDRGRIVFDGPCRELIDRPELLHGAYLARADSGLQNGDLL